MKLSDIIVNPENHHEYNQDGLNFYMSQEECLKAHLTLNNYLDDKLGGQGTDWGAHYNSWLERFGIPANSDAGWWSVQAVEPDNIKLFVLDCSEPWGDEAAPEALFQLEALIPEKSEVNGVDVIIESRADTVVTLLALNNIHIPESFCNYEGNYDK